jgi:hypothetical protein
MEVNVMKANAMIMVPVSFGLAVLLLACGPKETETKEAVSTPAETTPASTPVTTSEDSGYAGLGLTEDEIKMLEERGVANVDSAEVASKIAGFEVTTPTYVPEGFTQGQYSVSVSGAAGMPPGMKPKFNNTNVQIIYTYKNDRKVVILLLQAVHKSGIGDAGVREPVDICGSAGESVFVEANSDNGQPYDHLILSWEKDGIYYTLSGTLGQTLDKPSILKMACSIGAE